MSKKHIRAHLENYFIRMSPLNWIKTFNKIQPVNPYSQNQQQKLPTKKQIVGRFLFNLEVVGPPASFIKKRQNMNELSLNKICERQRVISRGTPLMQSDQLIYNIKQITDRNGDSYIHYQELEQRLIVANLQSIKIARTKLSYLFKILLNKRTKLNPDSLQMSLNLTLCRTILQSFQKNKTQNHLERKSFEAMQKLFRGKQYIKNGKLQDALCNFTQVFKDQLAGNKYRQQALKLLCQDSQQKGDATLLQDLLNVAHEKGQKQYEQYIRLTIERIRHQNGDIKDIEND